jgi:hypothetical protein
MIDGDGVKARFGFSLPEDYLRFWRAGLLPRERATALNFSRYWLLSPDQIVDRRWPEYKIKQLVPCARTGGGDHYCWYVPESGDVWMADCPRDSDIATGFAPHFEGFIFRALLEEFADSWLIEDPQEMTATYKDYARRVGEVMRPNWTEILIKLASQGPTINEWEHLQVFSWREAQAIVNAELAFPMLNKEFAQHTP